MKLLAIETSTETMSLGVCVDGRISTVDSAGGAQASAGAMNAIAQLMDQAGLPMSELDAIVWGSGPGAFTGVRTACAIAQGLGYALSIPLVAVDALAACAHAASQAMPEHRGTVLAALDARMGELYVAQFAWGQWLNPDSDSYSLMRPDALVLPEHALLCGNACASYPQLAERAKAAQGQSVHCVPNAQSLLQLAAQSKSQGVAAQLAHPLYVRNKVAQTTAERMAIKAPL